MQIDASKFTPVNKDLSPTGEIRGVKGTPLDFTKPTPIGAGINDKYEQLVFAGGYDHNFVIDRSEEGLAITAHVEEPVTGRVMEVYTTEPGVQFYSGNFLDGTLTGKGGHVYNKRTGFTLETQHYPDSPNHPNFPSTILRPGQTLRSRTSYRFSTK